LPVGPRGFHPQGRALLDVGAPRGGWWLAGSPVVHRLLWLSGHSLAAVCHGKPPVATPLHNSFGEIWFPCPHWLEIILDGVLRPSDGQGLFGGLEPCNFRQRKRGALRYGAGQQIRNRGQIGCSDRTVAIWDRKGELVQDLRRGAGSWDGSGAIRLAASNQPLQAARPPATSRMGELAPRA